MCNPPPSCKKCKWIGEAPVFLFFSGKAKASVKFGESSHTRYFLSTFLAIIKTYRKFFTLSNNKFWLKPQPHGYHLFPGLSLIHLLHNYIPISPTHWQNLELHWSGERKSSAELVSPKMMALTSLWFHANQFRGYCF